MARHIGIALALQLGLAAPALAGPGEVPLPPRARRATDGAHEARQSFRRTVEYYQRWLRRSAVAHEAVPVYQVRGVLVARFLSRTPTTGWQAVHVFHRAGRTWIAVVPRSRTPAGLDEPPEKQ